MAYRIMAFQETGEEVCVADDFPNQEIAYAAITQAKEDHPEWYRFSVEYMKTHADYRDDDDPEYGGPDWWDDED